MKRIIQSMALLGMLVGGSLVAKDRAEACTNPRWVHLGEICECVPGVFGYEWCSSSSYYCWVGGGGCGDGPGTLPL